MSDAPITMDILDRLAGIRPGSVAAQTRALRPDVVRLTQASDEATFRPRSDGGFTRAERAAVGLRLARGLKIKGLAEHYGDLLKALDKDGRLEKSLAAGAAVADDRWRTILAHADRVGFEPAASRKEDLSQLAAAGLSPQAILALSELIAYVSYQARVQAALMALAGSGGAGEGKPPAVKPMRDFTRGELEWEPWITPVDLATASAAQLDAMQVTPSNRGVGAYTLVLAHDPETLKQRSPLYNAIMFGPRGLPRADRELGTVVVSRINGCAYCAAVHAKRFIELSKAPEVMEALHRDGLKAKLDPRRAAIVAFAAKLTANPASLGPEDLAPLRAAGLSDGDILDLAHAVAMFAWANRLMLSLGAAAH